VLLRRQRIADWFTRQVGNLIETPPEPDARALSRSQIETIVQGGSAPQNIRSDLLEALASTHSVRDTFDYQAGTRLTVDCHSFLERASSSVLNAIAASVASSFRPNAIEYVFVLSYPRDTSKASYRKLAKELQKTLRMTGAPKVQVQSLTPAQVTETIPMTGFLTKVREKPVLVIELLQQGDTYVLQVVKYLVREAKADVKAVVALFGRGEPLRASVELPSGELRVVPTDILLELDIGTAGGPGAST
jgi:hypothetical protein